jgi:HEAT repeats
VSTGWDEWARDVFGDPYLVWHDGTDHTTLFALAGTDIDTVDAMLLAGVTARDPLAACAVAALTTRGFSVPRTRALLPVLAADASGMFAIRAAQAMYAISGDAAWSAPIAELVISTDHWSVRINAVIALAGFPPLESSVRALEQGVQDDDYLVRCHSASTLRRYAGIVKSDPNPRLLAVIGDPAETASPAQWRADLQKAASRLAAAATKAHP